MSVKGFASVDRAFAKTSFKDVSSLVRSKDFNANEKLRLFGLSQGVALNKKSLFGKTTSVNPMNLSAIVDTLREKRAKAKKPKSLNRPVTDDPPKKPKSNLKILTSPSVPRLGNNLAGKLEKLSKHSNSLLEKEFKQLFVPKSKSVPRLGKSKKSKKSRRRK